MEKLANVSVETLQEALHRTSEPKAVQRLMVALAYKGGVSIPDQSDQYGIPKSTLYYWLDRLAEDPLEDALYDDERPGRPAKLTPEQVEALRKDLDDAPSEHGYDGKQWTPSRVSEHIEREYGTSYSVGHVRRRLREWSSD